MKLQTCCCILYVSYHITTVKMSRNGKHTTFTTLLELDQIQPKAIKHESAISKCAGIEIAKAALVLSPDVLEYIMNNWEKIQDFVLYSVKNKKIFPSSFVTFTDAVNFFTAFEIAARYSDLKSVFADREDLWIKILKLRSVDPESYKSRGCIPHGNNEGCDQHAADGVYERMIESKLNDPSSHMTIMKNLSNRVIFRYFIRDFAAILTERLYERARNKGHYEKFKLNDLINLPTEDIIERFFIHLGNKEHNITLDIEIAMIYMTVDFSVEPIDKLAVRVIQKPADFKKHRKVDPSIQEMREFNQRYQAKLKVQEAKVQIQAEPNVLPVLDVPFSSLEEEKASLFLGSSKKRVPVIPVPKEVNRLILDEKDAKSNLRVQGKINQLTDKRFVRLMDYFNMLTNCPLIKREDGSMFDPLTLLSQPVTKADIDAYYDAYWSKADYFNFYDFFVGNYDLEANDEVVIPPYKSDGGTIEIIENGTIRNIPYPSVWESRYFEYNRQRCTFFTKQDIVIELKRRPNALIPLTIDTRTMCVYNPVDRLEV